MNPTLNNIRYLLIKDLKIEWHYKFAIGSALLYIISTVFITYLVFLNYMAPNVWAALFWIIIIFVSINTVARSFVMESKNRYYYYYTLASPEAVIMGKILYNNLIMLVFTLVTYFVFSVFFENYIQNSLLFYPTLLLGSCGMATMLTLTTAIAWKANDSFALVSVLSFPLALPLIILSLKLTRMALGAFFWSEAIKLLFVLLLLDIIIIALAYILFPFIWKD